MLITSTDSIPGRNITEVKGMVRGNTVRARNIGRDIMAGLPQHCWRRDAGVHGT